MRHRFRYLHGWVICAGVVALAGAAYAVDRPVLPKMPDSTPAGKPHFDSTGVQVGEQLPDLPLYTLEGKPQSLRGDWSRNPTLLLTSSYSCPKSRGTYPSADALAAKLKKDISTVIIYVIEAHPKGDPSPYSGVEDVTIENRRDQIFCAQPKTLDERLVLAKFFQKRLEITEPIFVDAMDNAVWKSLGGGPNMGFLVDRNGIVLARQGWFDAKSMEIAAEAFRAAIPLPVRGNNGGADGFTTIGPTLDGDLDQVKAQVAASPDLAKTILPFQPRGALGDCTLLHYAVERGHLPIVEFLVAQGADVNLQTEHKPSPLHLAAKGGNMPIAKFLMDHGAKINAKGNGYGPTPLQEALIYSNATVADLLLESGATTNFFTDAASGNLDAVRKQLAIDPTLAVRPDGWDRPPLAYAASAGQEKIVAALIADGARDLSPRSYAFENSAIWWAVRNKNASMVRLLCLNGSDPNLLDELGAEESPEIMRELLTHKADPNEPDISGNRPLENAAFADRVEIIRLLLDAGADPNAKSGPNNEPCGPPGEEWTTALHLAAESGAARSIGELLKHGAKVNALDFAANTPLHSTAKSYAPAKIVDAVKELLAAGAEVNPKNAAGLTPLDLALKTARTGDKSDTTIVDLLRARGAKTGAEIPGPAGVPPAAPGNN